MLAGQTAAHERTGPVINTLVVGDSYVAGNGAAGATYNVSPDDPNTPPAPFEGPTCYRRYLNSSHQAYGSLGSSGWYINRACSGKQTGDVWPEVADLANTPYAAQTDLIIYSAGGNDVNFHDIGFHCILSPTNEVDLVKVVNGKEISSTCYDLLTNLVAQE